MNSILYCILVSITAIKAQQNVPSASANQIQGNEFIASANQIPRGINLPISGQAKENALSNKAIPIQGIEFLANNNPLQESAQAIPNLFQKGGDPPINIQIVGGYEVNPEFKYPWMVSLQYRGKHSCGGSLMNGNTIVSAAHCLIGIDSDWKASIHRHNLTKTDIQENGKTYQVIKRIPHPNYNKKTHAYDVAIWKIDTSVGSSTGLKLDNGKWSNADGQLLTVIGWGTTSSGGVVSPVLLEVQVPVVNANECKSTAYPKLDIKTQFCAGYQEGGKDSCQGDSGGPLFIEENGSPILVGIVSWGQGCALEDYPGVYTRTSATSSFIQQYL